MIDIQLPKGFRDISNTLALQFHELYTKTWNICQKYGCELLMPSIVENAALFMKNMENSSVVVDKEIFMIANKDNLVLRPEMTASTVRYLTNNNINRGRYYYYGPNFRGERPQEGRYRQFYQIGVEMINGTNDIYDCINMIIDILKLIPYKYTILINHMGNKTIKSTYEKALYEFLKDKQLSEISQQRFKENRLLRILDSKEQQDKDIIINAPKLYDYLDIHYQNILNDIYTLIQCNNIDVKIDNNLVRGLDYYSGLLFEIIDNETKLAVGGGGEYNNMLCFKNEYLPCIGFAFGVDRIANKIELKSENKILVTGSDKSKVNQYAKLIQTEFNTISYIINTNNYKKLPTIAKSYKCNITVILYENDIRINYNNDGINISYNDFSLNTIRSICTTLL